MTTPRIAAAIVVIGILSFCELACQERAVKQVNAPRVVRVQAPPTDTPSNAANSACLVCHMYFGSEMIVTKHEKKNILCVTCHGASEPHRADETLRTKPDILWGRAQVAELCRQCHNPHKNPDKVEAFRKEWSGKARPNGRFIGENSICTDCHGEHTIPPKI